MVRVETMTLLRLEKHTVGLYKVTSNLQLGHLCHYSENNNNWIKVWEWIHRLQMRGNLSLNVILTVLLLHVIIIMATRWYLSQ